PRRTSASSSSDSAGWRRRRTAPPSAPDPRLPRATPRRPRRGHPASLAGARVSTHADDSVVRSVSLTRSRSGRRSSGVGSIVPGMTEIGTDWRVVDGVATAWFDAPSLIEGAALAGRIVELSAETVVDRARTRVALTL